MCSFLEECGLIFVLVWLMVYSRDLIVPRVLLGVRLWLWVSAAIPWGRDMVPCPGREGIVLSEVRVGVSVPPCVPSLVGKHRVLQCSSRNSSQEQQGGSKVQLPGLCKQGAFLSFPSPSQGSCSCCIPTEQGNAGSSPRLLL